jgi:general stress protein YciG
MNDAVKKYLAEIGKKGGSVTSKAKAEAARKNGKRGGRPRKEGTK